MATTLILGWFIANVTPSSATLQTALFIRVYRVCYSSSFTRKNENDECYVTERCYLASCIMAASPSSSSSSSSRNLVPTTTFPFAARLSKLWRRRLAPTGTKTTLPGDCPDEVRLSVDDEPGHEPERLVCPPKPGRQLTL